MDKMQSKQHTLREETLTHNTLNCMVCKHILSRVSSRSQVKSTLWGQRTRQFIFVIRQRWQKGQIQESIKPNRRVS